MTNEQLNELHRRFSTAGVSFERIDSGPVVKVANAACTATVALHGAHVLSWIPRGAQEVIFTSRTAIFKEGTAVRGGIPVCWPWFNDHPSDPDAYSHGFARRVLWKLDTATLNGDTTVLSFSLEGTAGSLPHWPHAVDARLTVSAGASLEISIETRNRGEEAFTVSQALHTYFAVGDIEKTTIVGLDGCRYHDDVANGERFTQAGPVTIKGEVDRVYLDTEAACTIVDPGLKRRIRVEKSGSRTTVVWNPAAALAAKMKDMEEDGWRRFLCVETTNALEDRREILPGIIHVMTQRISLEALD